MLFLAIFILSLLAIVNYRIGKSVVVYPAFVFCCVWAAALIVIWLAGDFYYPLSTETLWTFASGGVAFSIGSALALALPPPKTRTETLSPTSNRMLNALLVLVLCGIPFAARWLMHAVAEEPTANILTAAYRFVGDPEVEDTLTYSLFANFLTLAGAVGLIAFFEREVNRKRAIIAMLSAIGVDFMTGGRSAFVFFILSVLCLDWLRTRRIRWKLLGVMALVLLILASITAVYLGKLSADPNASLVDNAGPVIDGLIFYATGGLVAYDQVLRTPNAVPHSLGVAGFFTHLLHKIDLRYQEPFADVDPHSKFVCTGPGVCSMNLFTFYFTYVDFGYFGMMAAVVGLGLFVTSVYRFAICGSSVGTAIYAVLFPGIMLSMFQEYFIRNLNPQLKTCALFWLVYRAPGAWHKFRELMRRGVDKAVASALSP